MIKPFIEKINWAISRGLMAVGLSVRLSQVIAYVVMAAVTILAVFLVVRGIF